MLFEIMECVIDYKYTGFTCKTSEFWGRELYVFSQRAKRNSEKSQNVDFDMKTSFENVLSGRIGICAPKYVYRGVLPHIFDEKNNNQWLRLWRAPLCLHCKPTALYGQLHTISALCNY